MGKKLNKTSIEKYLKELGAQLAAQGKHIELQIFGGSAVALHYNKLRTTNDVDALFDKDDTITNIIEQIGKDNGLDADWLNSDVKRTLSKVKVDRSKMVKSFSAPGITCYVVPPDMLLATKAMIVMRDEPADRDDIITMCKILGIKTGEDIQKIVKEYYPQQKGFMDYQVDYFDELAEESREF